MDSQGSNIKLPLLEVPCILRQSSTGENGAQGQTVVVKVYALRILPSLKTSVLKSDGKAYICTSHPSQYLKSSCLNSHTTN